MGIDVTPVQSADNEGHRLKCKIPGGEDDRGKGDVISSASLGPMFKPVPPIAVIMALEIFTINGERQLLPPMKMGRVKKQPNTQLHDDSMNWK